MSKKQRSPASKKLSLLDEEELAKKFKEMDDYFAKQRLTTVYTFVNLPRENLEALKASEQKRKPKLEALPKRVKRCHNPDKDDGISNNPVQSTQEANETDFSNKLVEECSEDEKNVILQFFELNKQRKLTREEVVKFFSTYFDIKTFKTIKRMLKSLGLNYVLEYVIDLRHRFSPEGELIYPDCSKLGIASVVEAEERQNESVADIKVEDECKNSEIQGSLNESEKVTEVTIVSEKEADKEELSVEKTVISTDITTKKSAPPIPLKSLLSNKKNRRGYLFARDIYNTLETKDFMNLLDKILSYDSVPIFYLFEDDLLYLDKRKNTNNFIQYLLNFFAKDEDGEFSCLIPNQCPTGDKLITYCSNNNITYITGNTVEILKCKLNSVKVIIPDIFTRKSPNPFHGEKIIGFDSCATFLKEDEINHLVHDAKTILLSDLQLSELSTGNSSGNYVLKLCAYYGQIKHSKLICDHTDKNIVNFYKENPVDVVYTSDFGFKVFARFAKIPCKIINEHLISPQVDIFDKIHSSFDTELKLEDLETDRIFYDGYINFSDGKIRIDNNVKNIVTVYRKSFKRADSLKYINLYMGDYIVIRVKDKVLVTEVTNVTNGIGRILFWGNEKQLKKEYPFLSHI